MTERLLEILSANVPIHIVRIEEMLGHAPTKDQREIRREIKRLRLLGWPIYSGPDGYQLDGTKVTETIASMRRRAKDMINTANILETLTAKHQIGLPL